MDHDRLRSWLALPPGAWPPDHYALIGLPRGTGDLADIEDRVLARMELLRPHQLLHPDAVTEGMNRLAQALVCLTDPVARAAYDRGLGIAPAPFEVVEDDELLPVAEVMFEPRQPAYEVVGEPEPDPLPYDTVAPYEVVPDEPRKGPPPLPLPPAFEVVPDEPVEPEFLPVEPVAPAPAPVNRRAVYRKLAALRHARRAWENLRPVLGDPTEALATPVAVLLFVRALADARAALPGVKRVIGGPGSPGGTVAALVRLPHTLHAVRTLVPSQRQAVARDWRRGYEAIDRERARLREVVSAARPRRPTAAWVRLARELRRTPEWCLLALGLAALLFAILRRKP